MSGDSSSGGSMDTSSGSYSTGSSERVTGGDSKSVEVTTVSGPSVTVERVDRSTGERETTGGGFNLPGVTDRSK